MLSNLVLFCVFGIGSGNPGITRELRLSANAVDHLADIRLESANARYPEENEIARTKQYERKLCRAAFGVAPDLEWIKGLRGL